MEKKLSGLGRRTVTAFCLIAVLVGAMYIGGWALALLAGVCLCLAVNEEFGALEKKGHQPLRWTGFAAVGADLAIVLLTMTGVNSYSPLVLALTAFALLTFVVILLIMRRKSPNLEDLLMSLLPLFHVGLSGFFLLALLLPRPHSLSNMLLTLVFVISVGGDTFAYFIGSAVGGPKMCPVISPKKTWSGSIGGLLGSVLTAVLVGVIYAAARPAVSFPPLWADALCGLVGGIAGQVGDLLASLVKRYCGVKDFSNIFPGHGGALDRLDSILFTALIVYSFSVIVL